MKKTKRSIKFHTHSCNRFLLAPKAIVRPAGLLLYPRDLPKLFFRKSFKRRRQAASIPIANYKRHNNVGRSTPQLSNQEILTLNHYFRMNRRQEVDGMQHGKRQQSCRPKQHTFCGRKRKKKSFKIDTKETLSPVSKVVIIKKQDLCLREEKRKVVQLPIARKLKPEYHSLEKRVHSRWNVVTFLSNRNLKESVNEHLFKFPALNPSHLIKTFSCHRLRTLKEVLPTIGNFEQVMYNTKLILLPAEEKFSYKMKICVKSMKNSEIKKPSHVSKMNKHNYPKYKIRNQPNIIHSKSENNRISHGHQPKYQIKTTEGKNNSNNCGGGKECAESLEVTDKARYFRCYLQRDPSRRPNDEYLSRLTEELQNLAGKKSSHASTHVDQNRRKKVSGRKVTRRKRKTKINDDMPIHPGLGFWFELTNKLKVIPNSSYYVPPPPNFEKFSTKPINSLDDSATILTHEPCDIDEVYGKISQNICCKSETTYNSSSYLSQPTKEDIPHKPETICEKECHLLQSNNETNTPPKSRLIKSNTSHFSQITNENALHQLDTSYGTDHSHLESHCNSHEVSLKSLVEEQDLCNKGTENDSKYLFYHFIPSLPSIEMLQVAFQWQETQQHHFQKSGGKTKRKDGREREAENKENEKGFDDPGQTVVSTLSGSCGSASSHSQSSSASTKRFSLHSSKARSTEMGHMKDPICYDLKRKKDEDIILDALHNTPQNHSFEGDTFWLSLPRTPSPSAAVFSLPVQLKNLEGITSLQYLQKYLTIRSSSKRLHRTIFKKYQDTENTVDKQMRIDTIPQALSDSLGEALPEILLQKCKRYVDVGDCPFILEDHYIILASVSERFYCKECLHGCLSESESTDLVEQLDFMDLSCKIENLCLNPTLKQLLQDIKRLTQIIV